MLNSNASIPERYFSIQKEYEKKFGSMICVLIQVGKFYEIYQYDPLLDGQIIAFEDDASGLGMKLALLGDGDRTENTKILGNGVDISIILNMRITSKNKQDVHSLKNPLMMGFPFVSYPNHRDLILCNGYTIVRIDQKDRNADNGDEVEREIVEVCSPGTEMDSVLLTRPNGSNSIVSIYIECQSLKKNMDKSIFLCGLSSIDIPTGQNTVCEIYSKEDDEVYAMQEVYRFLTSQNASELIINIEGIPKDKEEEYLDFLNKNLELERYSNKLVRCESLDLNYKKDIYQEQVFKKAFTQEGAIMQPGTSNMITVLDLEMFLYGRIAYTILLQYCYEHNESLVKKLQRPKVSWTDQKRHLILTHNAIDQLDLFPKYENKLLSRRSVGKKFDSLVSVLDNTCTRIGSRYLRRMLLSPITDTDKLQSIYNMTEFLMKNDDILRNVDKVLKGLPDIELLQRKVDMGILKPKEFHTLFNGYYAIYGLMEYLKAVPDISKLKDCLMNEEDSNEFRTCFSEICSIINFEKLAKAKFNSKIGGKNANIETEDSFLHQGADTEIDNISQILSQYRTWLNGICDHLNSFLSHTKGKKIELSIDRGSDAESENEDVDVKMNITLHTTAAKAKLLKGGFVDTNICGVLEFKELRSSKTIITSEQIRLCTNTIEQYQSNMEAKLLAKFYQIVGKVSSYKFFQPINNFISMLDFLKTNAQNAIKYRYYKPNIDKEAKGSYFKVEGLRHPLIERIIRTEYTTNDISLGGDKENGLLLFGVNSTGKSSLAKSMIVIIMAQAGFYVPCNLTYHPYQKIITRLSGNDNLIKGESSFIVEMSELRTILRNSDAYTLVLGDELCRGTESDSGTSLTVATMERLVNKGSTFIFSTHMHHLPTLPQVQTMTKDNKIRICHLEAYYDRELDKLVYNRVLQEGSGSSLYGLEVCKSLGLDKDFIDRANEIRLSISGKTELVSTKYSRYSSKVYMDSCGLCGKIDDLHCHHLKEQSTADDNGFIDHHHKNASFNLFVLCDTCHERVHKEGLKLEKQNTLEGVYIKVTPETPTVVV
ncbi:DNA mismatch repair ATPase MutS [Orpheovirus IHUMI-LCC2]|uniref:DNA mismatch repair ATPase MutS n=1 Tax=Orpheovirus IHUMI-LCC2 TaxID=2023057 RepID=A0A2I2L537_9VIRU|nr:DNA mismatch repair ATPase MutS [Orpheovirus IHUMI-LCC2]SNW62620.1 DNA mismatch repair ATPase MutS [Orpheovirus IHUMI-LCC2]